MEKNKVGARIETPRGRPHCCPGRNGDPLGVAAPIRGALALGLTLFDN
jgi:hypothetical protein